VAPPAVFAADPPAARRRIDLDGLSLVFHLPSGTTHILASPAPELLDALGEGPADARTLLARLAAAFDLADADEDALGARLAELEQAGLAWRAR
jgi:PqqD family protein of HPr-rel-A system